jgi:hypothetical protein
LVALLPKIPPPDPHRVVSGTTLLAGVSLVLVIVNIALASINASAQAEANRRQQMLAEAGRLNAVDTLLTRALVQRAEQGNDAKIEDLLKKAGVPFTAPAKP